MIFIFNKGGLTDRATKIFIPVSSLFSQIKKIDHMKASIGSILVWGPNCYRRRRGQLFARSMAQVNGSFCFNILEGI